ncbi:sulfurtransferase [uncultured Cellulomonas sp.]|uniref:sulfurtransferase n=1 Tax=uncultured Cellulomonas sp. TaxID=189682 RepID=UPI001AC2BE38|nr:sulfurtransferase [uncultured Cellulomonas sp.]MBN9325847.1 sulfurtransferase [Cellulomonas sp.]
MVVDTPADLGPEAVLVDVRWSAEGRPARDAYLAGHLPGAVLCDVETDLLGTVGGRRAGLPSPEALASVLGRLGIAAGTAVVAYDDLGGVAAAWLVWMLRALGQPAAVLDGGLARYAGDLQTGDVAPAPVVVEARPWPADRVADLAAVVSPDVRIVDARPLDRYHGLDQPADARSGHIPGAVSLFWRDTVDADGRLLPPDRLRAVVEGAGGPEPVVCYCGTGAGAAHVLLALEHAGLGAGRLYAGSWAEYGATDLPVAR